MNERILINFPTNIGDAVMALPALDKLHANFPDAQLSAIVSPRTKELLERNTFLERIMVFDKHDKIIKKIEFTFSLRAKFDIVVDFKNSLLPFFIGAKSTPFYRPYSPNTHIKDVYLDLIKTLAPQNSNIKSEFRLSDEEKKKYDNLKIAPSLFIACSSNALQKRYPYPYLKEAVDKLRKVFPITILGKDCDRSFYQDILSLPGIIDLVGKTKLYEIFYLLKKYAQIILCVDSSILHMASYVNIPIMGLFGQNSPVRYGPWSEKFIVLTNTNLCCVPCEKPHCKFNHKCMEIEPQAVVDAVRRLNK